MTFLRTFSGAVRPLGWALALLLTSCAATGDKGSGDAGANMPSLVSAQDLAGETCSASIETRIPRDPDSPRPLKLTCSDGPASVGLVRSSLLPLDTPAAGPERRAAIEAASKRSSAAGEIARGMTCAAAQWLSLPNGGEASIATCTLREGNWPQVVVTYADGRTLYQAAGLPVLLPVLARAIASESGKPLDLPPEAAGLAGANSATLCTAKDYAASDDLLRQARIASSRGDSAKAEGYYRSALDIQTRVFGPESPGVGEVLTSLALEVSNQQRFDEAASLFRRADPIVERSSGDFYRARLLAYRALDAANRTHFDEALQLARAATALRRRAIETNSDLPDDSGALASQEISRGELLHSLMIEAQMLLRLDDLASAEAAAGEALDIVVRTPGLPPWWRPNVLAFMGDLNAREGRLSVAERQHIDALAFRREIFGETGPTALSHLALGRIYGAEDARAASLASYHAAFDILEKERTARAAITFDQIAPFLAVAADPSVKATPEIDAEIFRAIQLTGASVTDQTIERSAARLGSSDPAITDLIRKADEARRHRDSLRITFAEETDKPGQLRDAKRETALAQEIVATDNELDATTKQLKQAYPSYAGLAEPGPVALDVFRAHLAPGEALVSFEFGSKVGWVVLVTNDRLVARPVKVTDDAMATRIGGLRRAFVPRLGGLPKYDLNEAHALYTDLMGPIEGELGGTKHLIVVAHGPLASLPMSVLPVHAPMPGQDYATADWLVKHYALSQVPTVRAFVALREAGTRRTAPASPFLAFADPSFSGPASGVQKDGNGQNAAALAAIEGTCRQGGPVAPELLRALAPLPETAAEATTVARILGAGPQSVHLGQDASEAVLRQQKLDQYGVLYFATHGLLPGELRCQSEPGLALSPPLVPATTRADDGLLEASEISELKLNADLVVLSACNTAEGAGRFGGDALSGLAEAFFYAGARGMIASHWQVPSKATVALMTGLFEQVKSSGTAEALRQSQIKLLEQAATSHPFYWGAFTLIGDGLTASDIGVASRQQ